MAWTEEDRQKVIAAYKAADPTPENSTEIIKDIAEQMEQSANGVRMLLVSAGVYVKKNPDATTDSSKTNKAGTTRPAGDKAPRASKESQIAELRTAIEAKGAEVDDEILSKLTGKAAVYFTKVLAA